MLTPLVKYYLNDALRFVCIKSVFVLTTECSSLTVTLVVTLRKFASLLFSIFYFSNPFTRQHWIATVLVFGGTCVFVELGPKLHQAFFAGETEAKREEPQRDVTNINSDVRRRNVEESINRNGLS